MVNIFCGIFNFNHNPINLSLLQGMSDNMAEWKPDVVHKFHKNEVGFVQWTRKNILNSLKLKLPIQNTQEHFYLCGSSRLDNRETLFKNFNWPNESTMPDEQLILKAYEVWGEDCPYYLEGDFAFVIWNKKLNKLFAARDIVGAKAFYYQMYPNNFFLFANTVHALLNHKQTSCGLDEFALAYYLVTTMTHPDKTCYEDIKKLPPAHYLIVENNQISIQRYWTPEKIEPLFYKDKRDYAVHFGEIFERAVKARLSSDYPTAMQWSSNVNSAAVTSVAARLSQQDIRVLPAIDLPCYFVSKLLDVRNPSHFSIEQILSIYPNINLTKISEEPQGFLDHLSRYQKHLEMPMKNIYHSLWLGSCLTQQADRPIEVMLTGQFWNLLMYWKRHVQKKNLIKRFQALKQRFNNKPWFWQEYSPIAEKFAKKYGFHQYHITQTFDTFPELGNCSVPLEAIYGVELRDPTADRQVIEFYKAIPSDVLGNTHEDNLLIQGLEKYLPSNKKEEKTQTPLVIWPIKFNQEFSTLSNGCLSSKFSDYLDISSLTLLLNNWKLSNHEISYLDPQFTRTYQEKFLQGMSVYTFLLQIKQLQSRKQLYYENEGKPLRWYDEIPFRDQKTLQAHFLQLF